MEFSFRLVIDIDRKSALRAASLLTPRGSGRVGFSLPFILAAWCHARRGNVNRHKKNPAAFAEIKDKD
jgi:hypothetical protein